MSNRVLGRMGAREVTTQELDRVTGGCGTIMCFHLFSGMPSQVDGDNLF